MTNTDSVRAWVGPKALYMPISGVVKLFYRYSAISMHMYVCHIFSKGTRAPDELINCLTDTGTQIGSKAL